MSTDQQLRQRAEELRQELKITMLQTRGAIIRTRKLTDQIASSRKRQSQDRGVALTADNVQTAQKKLDPPRLQ